MRSLPSLLLLALALAASESLGAEGAGRYRVEQDESGVWWFHGPGDGGPDNEGLSDQRFVSLGVCDISPGPTAERYDPKNHEYAAFRHFRSRAAWGDDARAKLLGWGFNTVGAWGYPGLASEGLLECRVLHWGGELGFPWCDLFDAAFAEGVDRFALRDVAPCADENQLLGWFTDNELEWYADSIFSYHLHREGDSATRTKLIEILREHYGDDFDAFQRDFDAGGATRFEDLGRRGAVVLSDKGKGLKAIDRFVYRVAQHYYKTVHDAIRRHDPSRLILGDRYMSYCPPSVARAAGPFVDVISTNFDWPDWTDGDLPRGYLKMLSSESQRPVLVSEWYVAADENRSGNKNTGELFTKVATQAERVETAERRLQALLGEPFVVGVHWFRYADEPTNGRASDGEDFNFGLVDIDNRPYARLTEALTRVNRQAQAVHAAGAAARPSDPVMVPRCDPALGFPAELERFAAVPAENAAPIADLRLAWDEQALRIGVVGFRYLDARLFRGSTIPDAYRQRLAVRGADGARYDAMVTPNEKEPAGDKQAAPPTSHRHRGVRFTFAASVPPDRLGVGGPLEPGMRLPLSIELWDPLHGATTWAATAILEEGLVARAGPANPGRPEVDGGKSVRLSPPPREGSSPKPDG